MRHVLKVPRHLKFPAEAPISTPIWISDSLLRETFECFSRGCRRHGSHIPGPLEARRRSSKRKNTSIAYSGGSSTTVDAVGLFGPSSHGSWWKQPQPNSNKPSSETHLKDSNRFRLLPSATEREESLSAVLSWFGSPPAPPEPQILEDEILPDADMKALLTGSELNAWEISFQNALLGTQSLEDLRVLSRKQNLQSTQRLIATTLGLQHLLKMNHSSDAVKEFMLDPILSPSGSRPLRVLVNALRGEWFDPASRAQLFNTICEVISLGTASPIDVQYVVKRVPHFKMLKGAVFQQLVADVSIHEYYQKILSAIQESKVISLEDLDPKFMISWIKAISATKFSPTAARLLWGLRGHSEKSEKELAANLVFKLFLYDFQKNAETVSKTSIADFLAMIPSSALPYSLINVTESILSWMRHATLPHQNIAILHWNEFLAGLDEKIIFRAFGQTSSWKEYLSHNTSEHEKAQRVVIASWVSVAMFEGRETMWQHTERHLRKLRLEQAFKDAYPSSFGYSSRDMLAIFLETIQSLALPNTNLLLRRLQTVTDDFLAIRSGDLIITSAEKALLRRFSVLENDVQYHKIRDHLNDTLVNLAESINKNLPLFLHVSRHYISRDELAFRVVLRILKHNLSIHYALSRAWPTRIERGQAQSQALKDLAAQQHEAAADLRPFKADSAPPERQGVTRLKATSINQRISETKTLLNPREVLDLVNHLAISFATSPAITARQALRKVYWCFVMLHRYGAPIESPITRALWHAGVTRYGKAGTSKKLLQWILTQVRLVEGDEVADMLLCSAGFRRQIEEQFADLKTLHDGAATDKMPFDDNIAPNETVIGALQRLERGGGGGVEGEDVAGSMMSPQEMSSPARQSRPRWTKPRTVEVRMDLDRFK